MVTGPVPKPSAQRRRRNKPTVPVDKAPAFAVVVPPEASGEWHPVAFRLFESLKTSGQSVFYQDSDWAFAFYTCEAMSRNLAADRMSAQMFTAVEQALVRLLVTEGDRRRMRIELERAAPVDSDEDAAVADIAAYRSRIGG